MTTYNLTWRKSGALSGVTIFASIPKGDPRAVGPDGRPKQYMQALHDFLLFEAGRIRGQIDRKGKAA